MTRGVDRRTRRDRCETSQAPGDATWNRRRAQTGVNFSHSRATFSVSFVGKSFRRNRVKAYGIVRNSARTAGSIRSGLVQRVDHSEHGDGKTGKQGSTAERG